MLKIKRTAGSLKRTAEMLKRSVYLVLVLCLFFTFIPVTGVMALGDTKLNSTIDMEELNLGSVIGQNGWVVSGDAQAYYSVKYKGLRSIGLVDNSTTLQSYCMKSVNAMQKGTVEWYSRAQQTNGIILFRGFNGANKVFGVGFGSSGKFVKELPDGSFVDLSNDSYASNTWYRFTVVFDCEADTFDVKIVKYDLTGVTVSSYDNATVTSNNQYIDKIQLLTSISGTGTGYYDNISFYSDSKLLMDEGFEGYSTGNLNGQGTWTVSGSSVVVENSGAFSGSKQGRINGSVSGEVSASKLLNTYINVTSEVWVKAAQTNKELFIIGKTGSNESFKAGFGSDGKSFYFDGSVRTDTGVSYSADTWYRIRVNTYGSITGYLYKMEVIDQSGTSLYRSGLIKMVSTTPDVVSYIDSIEIKTPAGSGTFYFDEWTVMDHDVWYNQTFEGMSAGDVNGKEGWTGTSTYSTVLSSGAYEGQKCLKLEDTSTSSIVNAKVTFPSMKSGTYEYWIKASQTNQILYMELLKGTLDTVRIALAGNGHFYTYNGQTGTDTGVVYNSNTWYRCVVAFDNYQQKYDWYVYDQSGVQLVKVNDNTFYSALDTVDALRFITNSSNLGTFYVDNISVLNSGGLQEQSVFDNINLLGKNGDWFKDKNDETGTLAWGETYVLDSYLNMYEAHSATAYLDKFIDHADGVLNTRDSVRGVTDYKGTSENAWRSGGRYTLAESVRKDVNGYDTLKVKAVRGGDQVGGTKPGQDGNSIYINISPGTNNGTFKLSIHSHTIGYEYTFDNLNMDPASPDYALTRVNGNNYLVALWDMGSSSPVSERIPVNTTQEENLIPQFMYLLVDNGYIAAKLARYVDIVYNTPSLYNNATYKSKADTYKAAVMDIFDLFEPYWMDEGTEGYYKFEYGSPFWCDGIDEPQNRVLALGMAYLYLYGATGDSGYRDKAEHMANFFKNDLQYVTATDSYDWTYWDKDHLGYIGWTLGSGLSSNTKSFIGNKPQEDLSHGRLDLVFAYVAYKKGIVFNSTDMNRFANTFLNVNLKSDGLTWSTYVSGSGISVMTYGVSDWLILTEFNSNVFYRYYDLVNMADVTVDPGCLSVSGYLNWAKTKLP